MLLTGNLIFADKDHPGDDTISKLHKQRAAAECDLSMLDNHNNSEWASVNRRGKAFIKALLVLDETQRLTVKQALNHPFLTSRSYVHVLDKIYQRAVRGWKPRVKGKDIVRVIDTSDVMPSPPHHPSSQVSVDVKSEYFDYTQQQLNASPPVPPSSQPRNESHHSYPSQDAQDYNALNVQPSLELGDLNAQPSPELGEHAQEHNIITAQPSLELGEPWRLVRC